MHRNHEKKKTTGVVTKPILSNTFNSQLDLIDMQSLVPDVDRGPSDPPNLACRIVDICYETKMHELACQAGVLKAMYARNAFDKLDGSLEGIRVDVKTANQIGGCQLNSLYIFLAVFYNMIKVLFLATESTCNILIFIIKFTWLKAILTLKSR